MGREKKSDSGCYRFSTSTFGWAVRHHSQSFAETKKYEEITVPDNVSRLTITLERLSTAIPQAKLSCSGVGTGNGGARKGGEGILPVSPPQLVYTHCLSSSVPAHSLVARTRGCRLCLPSAFPNLITFPRPCACCRKQVSCRENTSRSPRASISPNELVTEWTRT